MLFVGVLLLLSLLQFTQSASIVVGKVAESIAVTNMVELGENALKILVGFLKKTLFFFTGWAIIFWVDKEMF